MRKIDIHLHLTGRKFCKNEEEFIANAESMARYLKKLGISKGILMSVGESSGGILPFIINDECRELAKRFPGSYGWMCNLDETEEEHIYDRIKYYKGQGAVGIGELMINRRLDDIFIQTIFSSAEELHMPVLFHMSPAVGYGYGVVDEPGLPLLEENLKRYPGLKFIGHSQPFWHEITKNAGTGIQDRIKWGEGKIESGGRLPYLFENYPNLYGDLSANSGGCAIMRDREFGLSFMKKYSHKLFFGTDMVKSGMEFPLGKWMAEKYLCGELDRKTYENICFGNALEILKVVL